MDTRTHVISSKAPTRIDLAGGTLDIWPLYLFLRDPITLNLAIDLFAEAQLSYSASPSTHPGNPQVLLESEDQGIQLKLSWEDVHSTAKIHPGLELHARLLRYFVNKNFSFAEMPTKSGSFHLKTRAKSPAGAGLGGSSSLSIALIGALATWVSQIKKEPVFEKGINGVDFIEIVRDVETTVIQVPAGLQDYYGAMFGGLQSLKWGAGTHQREWLSEALIPELEKRILLFYSGTSRNSGINNWQLFKDCIDQKGDVRNQFQKIADATLSLEKALLAKDWRRVGEAIADEWDVRRKLAEGITTPEIDRAFAQSQEEGPVFGKVCGAGGGGCFFTYFASRSEEALRSQKEAVRKNFEKNGMRCLEFKAARHGLEVQVSRA